MKTILLLSLFILASCSNSIQENVITNKPQQPLYTPQHADIQINTNTPAPTTTNHSVPNSIKRIKNYTNQNENAKLKHIEQYLRNLFTLIDEAEAYQDLDTQRIPFEYNELRRDIGDIANSVNNHILRDSTDTSPRPYRPLSKRY